MRWTLGTRGTVLGIDGDGSHASLARLVGEAMPIAAISFDRVFFRLIAAKRYSLVDRTIVHALPTDPTVKNPCRSYRRQAGLSFSTLKLI